VFIVVHNAEATSVTTGQGVTFCNAANGAAAAASADGVAVLRVAANASMISFAGVAAQDIVSDGYGLSQVWGYNSSIMMSHEAANLTVGAGLVAQTILQPGGLAGTFTSLTPQDALSTYNIGQAGKYIQIYDTCNISLSAHSAVGVFAKGFIRGL
jgi:hypothetical protein